MQPTTSYQQFDGIKSLRNWWQIYDFPNYSNSDPVKLATSNSGMKFLRAPIHLCHEAGSQLLTTSYILDLGLV